MQAKTLLLILATPFSFAHVGEILRRSCLFNNLLSDLLLHLVATTFPLKFAKKFMRLSQYFLLVDILAFIVFILLPSMDNCCHQIYLKYLIPIFELRFST